MPINQIEILLSEFYPELPPKIYMTNVDFSPIHLCGF